MLEKSLEIIPPLVESPFIVESTNHGVSNGFSKIG